MPESEVFLASQAKHGRCPERAGASVKYIGCTGFAGASLARILGDCLNDFGGDFLNEVERLGE